MSYCPECGNALQAENIFCGNCGYDIINKKAKNTSNEKNILEFFSFEYVDSLNGLEFEEYTCSLLKLIGFINVIKTPATGDFGIDILLKKKK